MWIDFCHFTFVGWPNYAFKIKKDYSTEILCHFRFSIYILSLHNFKTFYGSFLIKSKEDSKFQSETRGLQCITHWTHPHTWGWFRIHFVWSICVIYYSLKGIIILIFIRSEMVPLWIRTFPYWGDISIILQGSL